MSSSVFKEYPATNDENDKLNSSLVIVLNKNGSVSVDQKALRTLLGNESGDTSVSVIRVTSPTPSLEEEIEKEKKEKLKLSFPSNNDSDDDEEYENEMDDKMERMSNSNVSKIEDQAPHVSISVEEFYPPEDTKKLVADILQYAGMTSHLALDTDYEFKRYVIQNDHCYTPLTSPSQLHSSRSESPLHGNDPLTVRQKLQTQRQELISKLNEESSFDEEKSENVFESTSSSEELSVSESENDRDSDLDYNINERAMRSKRGARKSSRGFSRSSSNNNRCGLKVLKKRQSMSLVADRDVDLTAEFDSKDESGNTSSLVKKRKFFKKNVKGGLNTSTSTSINIKNFMKSTQVKSTPKHGNKIRSTICDKNEQEPSSKLIDFEQKATSDTTTTLGKIDIKSAISIPTLSIPSGSNSKPAPPKKDKKPLAHVEALFTDMTSLFSTPDIIKKVGGADGSTKADCSSPPPLVLNKTFMPLTPSNAKKQQLPAQISVQTHNSSAETDKFQFDLIDSIVKGELDKNNSINTNSMTEDIPNIVKMLENPDQSIDPELLNNVIGISSSQGNSSTTISTSSGIINTNIPTTALDDNNLDDLANADLLEELSSAEGLTEDLLQHVAELAENKHLQEVIDKQVLGVKNQSTVIDEIPPLIVMTQQLSTSTLPQVQSIEEKESPFVKLAQQKQLVKEANVTPSMRREPIKIIRSDGRVITLPPIEAPATRGAKRRAQNTPTSNATTGSKSSSSTPPSFSLLSKIPFIEQEQLNVPTLPVIPTKISYLNEDPKIIPKKGVPKLEKDLNSKNIRRASTTPSVAESEDNMDSDESWNSEDDPDRLWCICKQPHNNRFMICCDSCEDWFHGKCVNITKAMGQQMEEDGIEWTCPNCVKKISNQKNTSHGSKDELGTLLQSDKIISSLESNLSKCIVCKKQARPNSIYCSDDCIRKHAKISVVSVKPTAHQRVNSSSPPPLQPVDTPKKSEQNVSGNLKIEKTVKRIGVLKNKYDRVIVYNKITGKCLTGDSAPTLSNLKQWLQENPNYDVVQPGSVQAQAFKAKQSQLQQLSKDLNVKKQQEQSESQKQKIQSQLKIGTHKQIIFVNPHKSNSVISSQPCSSNNKPQLQPSTIKGKIISHVLKNPTIQTPAQVKPQVILNRSISSEKSVQKNIQTKSRKLSSGDSKVQPSPSKNEPEPIRVNVRRTLKEQLSLRMNEVTDSEKKLSDDEIAKYALETENEMFSLFNKDTGAKYKAKYRSLMFNIKDRKNLSLFQKICNKSILPKQLVRMSADELASQELARWRENENKHQLEMIKKSELDLLACAKNYVLKTHKGEEVIESRISDRVTIDPLIAVEDVVSILNNSAVSSTSEAASLSSVKIPHSSMVTPSKDHLDKSDKIKDLTSSNKSHSSSSKKKDREKESRGHDRNKHESSRNKSSKHKRKRSRDRRSRSRDKEERRSSKEKERDRDRDSGRKEKESNRDDKKDKIKEKEKEINKNSKTVSSSTKEKESTNVKKNNDLKIQKDPLKSIVVKKDEVYNLVDKILEASSSIDKTIFSADELKKSKTVLESPPLTDIKKSSLVIENDQEPSSTVTIPTPPEHIYDNRDNYNLNSIANIWTGSINMVDVATFHITAQPVSGDCDEIAKDLPVALDVVGRISPDTVWDYINKIKKSFNKEILIIRLGAMADSEKMPYFALYSYLDTRKRLGVVKTSSTRIKDFYILPLAAHKSLPSILLPIHGSGFIEGDSRPDLLLGIIVKIKTKRTTQLTISGTLPAKIKRSVNCKSDTLTPLSNNDDNFTPPSSPKEVGKINLTETRSKLTLGLPKSSKDVSPVLPIPILLPKVSNLDDDEPYSPGGSDDDDVASDIPLLPSLNHSSISGLDSDDIQRKMEELNRQIEAQKMEIAGILNKEHDDLDEPYSPSRPVTPPTPPPVSTITSLANISIPSNLQEILASIKGVASASQPADKSSNLTSSPPPPPTIGALTSAIPDIEDEEYTPTAPTVSIYKSLDYIPNKTASAYIPPSTISLTPTVGTSSNGTGTSKLAQLSEAELLSMVPDDALIDDITTVNKENKMESLDNEPLSKKSKWDDNEPPPPGLEDEYDPL